MKEVPASRYLVFLAIASTGCALDLVTKHLVFSDLGMPGGAVQWIWPGYVGLETSLNEGALFGLGQGFVWLFVLLSLAAFAGISYWLFWQSAAKDWLLTIALGGVTAGIFGNLYDRLGLHGLRWNYPPHRIGNPVYAVRDWVLIQINHDLRWPNFNIADSLLVCGALLLAWHAMFCAEPPEPEAS